MIDKVVASLALLKVNWEKHKDYVDNFVPFVAECLRVRPEPQVALGDLQADILETFGIRIPESALKTILNRAAKSGYVRAERNVYVKNRQLLEGCSISQSRQNVQRQFEALVRKLCAFSSNRFGLTWSQEQAEAALFAFFENAVAPILETAIDGKPIVPLNGELEVKNAEFVVGSFVTDMNASDPDGFQFFVTIAKGRMLADVLLYPDLGGVRQKFDGVEVYLDTQFVLRALGHAGMSTQSPCLEVIELLYAENARIRIFEHTFYEMRGVLEGAAKWLQSSRRESFPGETLQFFISNNFSSSDVDLIVARLESSLNKIHIHTKSKPPHIATYGLNENDLESFLNSRINYKRREALNHDLDCLTAIHRIRKGQISRKLETCGAIFVTTNPNLARASREFFMQELGRASDAVPHCILDHVIGTLVWLKQPLKKPNLPEKRIIADCYAALNPSDALWREYMSETTKLHDRGGITVDDYALLRYSIHAKTSLMDVTLGDPDVISEGTIHQVLERAQNKVAEKANDELCEERAIRVEAELKAAVLATQVSKTIQRVDDNITTLAQRAGRVASWVAAVAFLLVLTIGTWFAFITIGTTSHYVKSFVWACVGIAAAFGLLTMVNGTYLEAERVKLESWFAQRFTTFLRRRVTGGVTQLEDTESASSPPESDQ